MTTRTLAVSILTLALAACSSTPTEAPIEFDPAARLPADPYSVDVTGWKTYENATMGFALKYPDPYVVEEIAGDVIVRLPSETTADSITIEKHADTLQSLAGDEIYHAAIISKPPVLDGKVGGIVAYYPGSDANSWFMSYYLARATDIPQYPNYAETKPSYDIITAYVEAYPTEENMKATLADGNTFFGAPYQLSVPQQILSTFTFID